MTNTQVKLSVFNPYDYDVDGEMFNDFNVYEGDDRQLYIRSHKSNSDIEYSNDAEWEWVIKASDSAIKHWIADTTVRYGAKKAEKINKKNFSLLDNDIGKLCWFWDTYEEDKIVGMLREIEEELPYPYIDTQSSYWRHYRRLTNEEIDELK